MNIRFFSSCSFKPDTDDLLCPPEPQSTEHSSAKCNKSKTHSHSGRGPAQPNRWYGRGCLLCGSAAPVPFPPGLPFILSKCEKASCLFSGRKQSLLSLNPRGEREVGEVWEGSRGLRKDVKCLTFITLTPRASENT